MEKILIVEDELIVARDIRKTLERNGYKVIGVARTAEKAIVFIDEENPSLILIDIFLKGHLTGIDLAKVLNKKKIPFIYISANSNQQVLEAAKITNPFGFIVKPFREKDLLVNLDIARYRYETGKKMETKNVLALQDQNIIQKAETVKNLINTKKTNSEGLIGISAGMLHIFNLIQQVASFDTTVLILGESGTGKEGVAHNIFTQSKRNNKPFIKINCAAIPADLMEAEFFGYEKGAFTGATERKAGKFELASGGAMLLDEIGEMPIDMQVKLLRVLQENEIQRIGGSTVIKIDVRIIAATSLNLEKEVAEGRFRLDLYYRLNVFPIVLPPLRQRKEDIPLLINHFIKHYAKKAGKVIENIETSAIEELLTYYWPGNVRELQHLVERAVLLANGDKINIVVPTKSNEALLMNQYTNLNKEEETEKAFLLSVLHRCSFKIAGKGGAAEILNMPPTTLHSKIKKFGLTKIHSYIE